MNKLKKFVLQSKINFNKDFFEPIKISDYSNQRDTFLSDGNYLQLRVHYCDRKKVGCAVWLMKIKTRKSSYFTFIYLYIGCYYELNQQQARDKAQKIYDFIKKYDKRPANRNSNALVKWVFDDGSSAYRLGYDLRHPPYNLKYTDDDIRKINFSERNEYKEQTIFSYLSIIAERTASYTRKLYYYNIFDNFAVCKVMIGRCDEMRVQTAIDICEYITKKLHSHRTGKKADAIKKFVKDYKYTYLKKEPLTENEQKLLTKVGPSRQKIFISEDAATKIVDSFISSANTRSNGTTLRTVFTEWLEIWGKGVGLVHRNNVEKTVNKYLSALMDRTIKEVVEDRSTFSILLCLNKINAGLAHSLLSYLCRIVDYAIVTKVTDLSFNSLVSLKEIIKKPAYERQKSLDPFNLDENLQLVFKQYISPMKTVYRALFELLFYTLLRVAELTSIKRCNIFFEEPIGRLVVVKTKTLKEFSIPLTQYAQNLIKVIMECRNGDDGEGWLIPSVRDPEKAMPSDRFSHLLQKAGCEILVPHGIRSVGASFFAQHTTEIPYEVGVACLQHIYTTSVHLRYDRTFLYEPRKKAMQVWSDYLEKTIGKYSVLKIK